MKTLIDRFEYPRHGPGMMWERAQQRIEEMGSQVVLKARVTRVHWTGGGVRSVRGRG